MVSHVGAVNKWSNSLDQILLDTYQRLRHLAHLAGPPKPFQSNDLRVESALDRWIHAVDCLLRKR
jgi:hypothetical protein